MYGALKTQKTEGNENFTRQGSLRKVLPGEHKENLFGRQNEDLNKIYKNFHQEYVILAEYKMVQTQNIPGVYVVPSKENPLIWFGVIYVRSGPYEDGIFRFTIFLDEKFPDSEHPKVVFSTQVFHPVIDRETSELHLYDAFPIWKRTEQHIWQVLKYIQWIFYNLDASCLHGINKEAIHLYQNNITSFKNKAKELAQDSLNSIYEEPTIDDKHYLVFRPFNQEIYNQTKSAMLTHNNDNNFKFGHSWVLPGVMEPLSRPPTPNSDGNS